MSQVTKTASEQTSKPLQWLPWIAGAWALALLLLYALVFRSLPFTERPDAWGQFGDYMGGLLNPAISLLTLIVAVSVWNLQKTELHETRKAIKEQGETAKQQRREQRFFDLLNLYRSTVDSIVIEKSSRTFTIGTSLSKSDRPPPVSYSGKRAFRYLTSSAGTFPEEIANLFTPPNDFHLPEIAQPKDVSSQWNEHSPLLDHYFRVIFTILREAKSLLHEDRFRYIKILRAQLSRDEVSLIAMNLLYDEEGVRMRDLVKEYGLLKHLPPHNLRVIAERSLDPFSFGRKWATSQPLPV